MRVLTHGKGPAFVFPVAVSGGKAALLQLSTQTAASALHSSQDMRLLLLSLTAQPREMEGKPPNAKPQQGRLLRQTQVELQYSITANPPSTDRHLTAR